MKSRPGRAGDSPLRGQSPSSPRFIPGTVLAERYRIISLLGRGGMGEVYRADDLKLGQPVALKFLPSGVQHDRTRLDRFLNEVKTALKVTHPNVCRVYDIGEVDGQHCISMEYVDGEDLASLLRRIGRLPGDKAVQLARQVCAGLAAAHDEGILHRDLKPANVMIDGRGRAKITDFGLASLAQGIEGDEARAGTPHYMSPEQHAGNEITTRSDLYSLGLVLYELFTGKRAFDGTSPIEIRKLQEQSTPTSPSSHVEGLAPATERVILRCLERDPSDRPHSALAVAATLPGGDPLAAALAAGETPSPQMVADAGESGGLRPWVGVALLLVVLLGLLSMAADGDRFSIVGKVTLDKPPQALVVRAREVLARAGHGSQAVDRASGFVYDEDYFDYVEAQAPSATKWDGTDAGRPAPIQFWYRESPQHLVATRIFTEDGGSFVSPSEPPWTLAGMAGVWLDPQGRLLRLKILPPHYDTTDAPGERVDWAPVFEAAGLDLSAFTPSTPRRNPLITCDERLAWEGSYAELASERIRVEACAYGGKPAHFEVIPPWREEGWSRDEASSLALGDLFFAFLLIAVLIGGSLLAHRNQRLGRGDRRGAFRIALFVFLLTACTWVLQANHVPALSEIGLFFRFLGVGLVVSGLVWTVYIALEPYARRLWPDGLISWSRLLSGRLRDPMVGRDILIGAAAGVLIKAWWMLYRLLVEWLALPAESPRRPSLISLSGVPETLGQYADLFAAALYLPVGWLLLVLLLRVLLRRQWIALVVLLVLTVVSWAPGTPNPWIFAAFGFVAVGAFLLLLTRFGLLCAVFWAVFFWAGKDLVLTLDRTVWYAGSSWLTLLLLAAIAGYGFWVSLAGQPLMKAGVLDGP